MTTFDSAVVIADCVTHLINLSIETGVVPSEWKQAKVVPLFKSGNKEDLDNYRSISILPILSKKFWRKLSSISCITTYQKTLFSRLTNLVFVQTTQLSWL